MIRSRSCVLTFSLGIPLHSRLSMVLPRTECASIELANVGGQEGRLQAWFVFRIHGLPVNAKKRMQMLPPGSDADS